MPHVHSEALVIHRREDRTIPLEAGRRLAAELPHARFAVVDGKVHLPWIDGDTIAAIAHSFLAAREPSSSDPLSTFEASCRLDAGNREFVLEGQRVPATRLEYDVMRALIQANGRLVTRDEMLAEIWNTPFAGSNKVDAVIRLLRKKLGPFASSIETMTGHGYRFVGWKRTALRRSGSSAEEEAGADSTRPDPRASDEGASE